MTYFGMMREFGLKPDEVDKMQITTIEMFRTLLEILRKEERYASSRSSR